MSVVASELVLSGAANHAEDDTSLQGGAKALGKKIVFTDLTVNDQIEILSSSASDIDQEYDIVGKDGAGVDLSENLDLIGVTPVVSAGTYERLNKVVKTAGAALVGTVTVQRDGAAGVLATLENSGASQTGAEITEVRKIYIKLVVPAVTDAFYEKMFFNNTNSATSLTNAQIQLSDASDPTGTDLKIGNAPSVDDSATIANRLALPASVTFVDNQVDQAVPGGTIAAGSGIGVWIENTVTGGAAAIKGTLNVRLAGETV